MTPFRLLIQVFAAGERRWLWCVPHSALTDWAAGHLSPRCRPEWDCRSPQYSLPASLESWSWATADRQQGRPGGTKLKVTIISCF